MTNGDDQNARSGPPARQLRLLILLTYYLPHISGLTLYVRRLAEGLASRGHDVRVRTSRYDPALPLTEMIGGVAIHRSEVWARLSKGVIMPGFILRSCIESHRCDVVNVHLPQIEAAFIVLYARLIARKPVVTTYHCDLELPDGLAKLLFTPFIKLSHLVTVLLSTRVIANSGDYVSSSRFLRLFARRMLVCYPPCERLRPEPGVTAMELAPEERLVGFVGRFAEEKGVDYIVAAIPRVLRSVPNAVFAFVGEREAVIGEQVYRRLKPEMDALGDRVRLLGLISDAALASFYDRCNVLLLPSVNTTESFGMVQVEAMYGGTPVIASDIAGVRVPVSVTGMGRLVPPRNAEALAEAIIEVLNGGLSSTLREDDLERVFGVERALDFYEQVLAQKQPAPAPTRIASEAPNPGRSG